MGRERTFSVLSAVERMVIDPVALMVPAMVTRACVSTTPTDTPRPKPKGLGAALALAVACATKSEALMTVVLSMLIVAREVATETPAIKDRLSRKPKAPSSALLKESANHELPMSMSYFCAAAVARTLTLPPLIVMLVRVTLAAL